LTTLRKFYHK
jgi:hypothetical protein